MNSTWREIDDVMGEIMDIVNKDAKFKEEVSIQLGKIKEHSHHAFLLHRGEVFPVCDCEFLKKMSSIHLFPGSFNPLHRGHEELMKIISRRFQKEIEARDALVAYELSIERIDKEFLSDDSVIKRLKQFSEEQTVLVNRWPYFLQKTGILKGCLASRNTKINFHIGIDTAIRAVESHGTVGVQGINADFYVYERDWEGKLQGLYSSPFFSEQDIPTNFHAAGVAPDVTHISSTAIRSGVMDREGNKI